MSQAPDSDLSLRFPIEFMLRDTPRSHQSANARGKERWKRKVGEAAVRHLSTLGDFFFLDDRPLALTILYFPIAAMHGDVDNIVKLIVDGMTSILYPDDRIIERIMVQKLEPGTQFTFHSLTATLEQAARTDPPVLYIRIDDDLRWRHVLS